MPRYVIAVGGTGNKILESMVYAACADAFYTVNEHGQRRPISQLHLLSVDVDAACGNTTRAKRAAEYYESVRKAFAVSGLKHRCFHTRLTVDKWSMNLSRRAASVRQMAQGSSADRLLARALFTPAEANLEYSEGFRGHPDLGVLFFSDLLGSLEQARRDGQIDELNAMIDNMRRDIANGETVQVLLCGSIFGGTGASGIPALSQYLTALFAEHKEQFVMGAILMLPYYSVPAAHVDEQQQIAVNSDLFLDKARTALAYYGIEGMIKGSRTDEHGVFDALYLLGLPPEYFVCTRLYSTGSQSQENDAHLLEWLATRCAARFFRTGFRGDERHNIDCYYYQCHGTRFSWAGFDDEAPLYRARYGALAKAAAVYLSECHPTLMAHVCTGSRRMGRVGYCAAFFHNAKHLPAAERVLLQERLEALYHFFAFYVNWLSQVVRTLPKPLRGEEGEGGALPQNDLFSAELLDTLLALLTQYGETGRMSDRDCLRVQRCLTQLVKAPSPDRRDMGYIIGALGGGARQHGGADEAFSAFLSTLLASVMERI